MPLYWLFSLPKGDFILDTDASNVAVAAKLSQIQDGVERVISYGSYSLTSAQRRYCTTRQELLALVGFTEQYKHYLLGKHFYVQTDHNSLTWMMQFKNIEGQLARWLEVLAQFGMTILHRPGRKHCNADGLSQIPDELEYCDCYRAGVKLEDLPCKDCPYCKRAQQNLSHFEEEVDDVVPLAVRKMVVDSPNSLHVPVVAQAEDPAHDLPHTHDDHNDLNNASKTNIDHSDINDPNDMSISDSDSSSDESDDEETKPVLNQERSWVPIYSNQQLWKIQMNDLDLSLIIQHLDKTEPEQQELFLGSPAVCFYWFKREHLKIKNGVLYCQWKGIPKDRLLLVVPYELKSEVLTHCHDLKLG